MMYPQYTSSFK